MGTQWEVHSSMVNPKEGRGRGCSCFRVYLVETEGKA